MFMSIFNYFKVIFFSLTLHFFPQMSYYKQQIIATAKLFWQLLQIQHFIFIIYIFLY